MQQVAAAVAALDPNHVADALSNGRQIGIAVDGREHQLGADELELVMKPLEGYQLEQEGSHAVALDLAIDDELRREGLARDIVRAIQGVRKDAGLAVEQRIRLVLDGDERLLEAAHVHEGYIAGETLATSISYGGLDGAAATTSVEGQELRIAVEPAS
jgi:isoleucyl-tRNA synthetase